MADFPAAPRIAVAVSGGADSMALLLLLKEWGQASLVALTVDHSLREESEVESAKVKEWCAVEGIFHETLVWEGEKPASNIHEMAREARYSLMTAYCTSQNISQLFLGHHLQDQAETFLIRLGRGSGVHGLKGMAAIREQNGILLCRPLLKVPPERLKATLTARKKSWIDDPSNHNLKYTRTKMRQLVGILRDSGVSVARISHAMDNLSRADDALQHYALLHLQQSGHAHPQGYIHLNTKSFLDAPEEIVLRCLKSLLMAVSGNAIPPRFENLLVLWQVLPTPFRKCTLHGCLIYRTGETVTICREPAACVDEQPVTENAHWDGRFLLKSFAVQQGVIKALGTAGWQQIKETEIGAALRPLPYLVRLTMPCVWDNDTVVCLATGVWVTTEELAREFLKKTIAVL
jgi:tRNA(Ile)-lysidine synthase